MADHKLLMSSGLFPTADISPVMSASIPAGSALAVSDVERVIGTDPRNTVFCDFPQLETSGPHCDSHKKLSERQDVYERKTTPEITWEPAGMCTGPASESK